MLGKVKSLRELFGIELSYAYDCEKKLVEKGLPEMIENGRTGILFERGNHAELAARIVELLNDPARAKSIGAAARETALKRFSADRMAADEVLLKVAQSICMRRESRSGHG